MGLPLLIGAGAAVYTGVKMLGKLFGSDPDFTQAWMMNRMTGRGGFLKTYFGDGLGKLFLGSRSMSAMANSGMMGMGMGMGMPFAGSLYGCGAMGMMNPMMMNPMMMGGMPYNPMMMGGMMWGCR